MLLIFIAQCIYMHISKTLVVDYTYSSESTSFQKKSSGFCYLKSFQMFFLTVVNLSFVNLQQFCYGSFLH